LDPRGILRAAIMRKGGASTLPQQLMTNVFNLKAGVGASRIKRGAYKLRQIVLSKRLNTTLQKQIRAEKPGLSREDTKKEMKKKVLELYLNYIEFGNNAFGIEAAAKAYFGISASELSVLQSAILASLPKSPTLYSPLKEAGRKNLLGYFTITDAQGKNYPFDGILSQDIITKFRDAIQQSDFSNKNTSNASTKFLVGLGSFTIIVEGKEYYVKYVNGRKDVVLSRMFEDGYISEGELKQAYSDSLTINFQTSSFPIKAPHFVFRIREKLQEMYGEKAVLEGGMIVKTTLDYDIQLKAEEAFKNNERTLRDNGANNSAMIYIDTNNGDVLSYIGSSNYFDDEIQGQNDMVRKPRQSGSSIKPLVYSLGFQKLPLTIDTPIYDIPFQVGPDRPNNADDKFEGLLPLRLALGHSRNIPAVKMYLAAGGEDVVKPYLQQLGLSGIVDTTYYGYPLALGAGEVTMLELADAYSHLTTSTPAELNPILEITSSDGSILYKKEVQEKAELIPEGIKYLMWKILSEPNNRLPGRINKFNVAGLTYALKTGTSNVKTDRGNRPRDGRLAAYMPDKLVLMRAGNANATPMYQNAFGGTIHADPIKQFFKGLLDNNYLSNVEMTNVETATLTISKITGNIPADNTPLELQTPTIAYVDSMPMVQDESVTEIEYDAQCLGVASPLTPSTQVKH
jgi:membrane peptidoglycan carboxypeptidase